MRRIALSFLFVLAACTSAEERAREREQQMIEQARADSADEADFVADSLSLASSITLDSVRDLRIRDVREALEGGDAVTVTRHEAVGRFGLVCDVEPERYAQLVRGDTLRCQWGPAQ